MSTKYLNTEYQVRFGAFAIFFLGNGEDMFSKYFDLEYMMKKELWIGGKGVAAKEYYDLKAPFSGEIIAEIPSADKADVDAAIKAAGEAQVKMSSLAAYQRNEILEKLVGLLNKNKDEAAEIIMKEACKPMAAAKGEIARTIQTYQFAAEEAKRVTGEMIAMDAVPTGVGKMAFTKREPLGIIGAISPFNFPFNLVAHKIGPAFAAGNTVVLKPASQTPLSAYFMADLFDKAGLPAGALNVVTGSGAVIGEQIVLDDRIKMITFTGSPPVGKRIRSQAGLKRVTLELGSNSAAIIDKGVDLDKAAARCVLGAFVYQGQVCISLQRIYVHQTLMNEFLEKLVKLTKELKSGDPAEMDTDYSSLISENDAERVISWIDEAKKAGGKTLTGGTRVGSLVAATVMIDVPPGVSVSCREVFGPVVVVYPYTEIEDAIERVNDSVYGLQAGVFTTSLKHAMLAADKLEVGGVMINEVPTFRVDQMPYGGVKESGMGREGLKYAVEEMTEMKLVVMQPTA